MLLDFPRQFGTAWHLFQHFCLLGHFLGGFAGSNVLANPSFHIYSLTNIGFTWRPNSVNAWNPSDLGYHAQHADGHAVEHHQFNE